ncbi:hypothetical protein QMO56_26345 [Roseomonas sp. E05]|nr:hypothetical protein [Roseomonas sp. E05]MDJ0391624.1 hypothetical protein [Roseomonas sp. E05]
MPALVASDSSVRAKEAFKEGFGVYHAQDVGTVEAPRKMNCRS